jgi:signal transduction histidine kinase
VALVRRQMDFVRTVRDCVNRYQRTADRHSIVVVTLPRELVGRWDSAQLERIQCNLCLTRSSSARTEARYAFHYRRRSTLGTLLGDAARWAIVRVHDAGLGIRSADLGCIFGELYRGANVTGRVSRTGLGLARVRRMVAEQGERSLWRVKKATAPPLPSVYLSPSGLKRSSQQQEATPAAVRSGDSSGLAASVLRTGVSNAWRRQ